MKFSKRDFFKKWANLIAMVVAVTAAAGMWYTVNRSKMIETDIEVNITYNKVPPNLIVTQGLVNKLIVRVRGPETLLRSLPLEEAGLSIGLGSLKKGENTIPLPTTDMSLYPKIRSFTILDIQPPMLHIYAAELMTRKVKVDITFESPVPGAGLNVEEIGIDPPFVTLRGPEETIEKYKLIEIKVPIDPTKAPGALVKVPKTIPTPSFVTADPNLVNISYKITSDRVKLTYTCKVTIPRHDDNGQYEIEPPSVDIEIEVPESLEKSSSYLKQLKASVDPSNLKAGESKKFKVNASKPEGMTVNSISPEEVTVTRK